MSADCNQKGEEVCEGTDEDGGRKESAEPDIAWRVGRGCDVHCLHVDWDDKVELLIGALDHCRVSVGWL